MKRLLLLLVIALLTTHCSSGSDPDLSESMTPPTTLSIGVIAPLDAGLTAFGKGIRNSVQLAVDQANQNQTIPGVRLVVEARDDSSNPDVGALAATDLARESSLVGVIGTYNSGVAARTIPILGAQNIIQISPANTDPSLTLPDRPFANYFRMVVPDTVQGPFLARKAFNRLGFRKVAVVTESKSVSQGLATNFSNEFTALGGTVLITVVIPEGTADYTPFLAQVQATNPELLFYGGEYQTADLVRMQARGLGLLVPLMGGDGVKDDAYIANSGGAEGDFASTVGAPLAVLPGGPQFLADYTAAGFADPPTDFGPFAYDATNTLIDALRQSLSGTTIDRSAIIATVQAANLEGVTGPIAFDAFGDPQNQLLTLYQVQEGIWVPLP